jgi:type 1 glutamine amidotransferase
MKKSLLTLVSFFLFVSATIAQPRFRALVLFENGGHHLAFTNRAQPWLNQLAADSNFIIRYIQNTDSINDTFLSRFEVFIQLDYPPYGWKADAMTAFMNYMEKGKGGWIGLHHATLLGEFDGFPMWTWFSGFMGGIRFKNYIPDFAAASVKVEGSEHPCMKNLPSQFTINKEEWYTYDKSPRDQVHVLASVNESTYVPNSGIKMGDHPVVWTNDHIAGKKRIYFYGPRSPIYSIIPFIQPCSGMLFSGRQGSENKDFRRF